MEVLDMMASTGLEKLEKKQSSPKEPPKIQPAVQRGGYNTGKPQHKKLYPDQKCREHNQDRKKSPHQRSDQNYGKQNQFKKKKKF